MFKVAKAFVPSLKFTAIPAQVAPSEAVAVRVIESPTVRLVLLAANVRVAAIGLTVTFTVLLVIT
jgi:hypothetical protein